MKKILITLIGLFFLTAQTVEAKRMETTTTNSLFTNNTVTFVENGITFSVYNDGEFDFFINRLHPNINANVNVAGLQITFNSGFNYNPFIQYDDYGAIIQVENTPVFYDYYGRVFRIGNINLNYDNFGNLVQVGGLFLYYDSFDRFSHTRGFINPFNQGFRYPVFYNDIFFRPGINFCLVSVNPYRRFYTPIRYTFCSPYRNNFRFRHARARFGHIYHSAARINTNRRGIYRNDRRVARRNDAGFYNTRRTVTRTTRNTRANTRNGNTRSTTRNGNTRSTTRNGNTRATTRNGNTRSTTRNGNTRSTTRNNVRSNTRNTRDNLQLGGVRGNNNNNTRIERENTRNTRNNSVRSNSTRNNTRATRSNSRSTRDMRSTRSTRNNNSVRNNSSSNRRTIAKPQRSNSSRATRSNSRSSNRSSASQRSSRSQKKTTNNRQRSSRKRN